MTILRCLRFGAPLAFLAVFVQATEWKVTSDKAPPAEYTGTDTDPPKVTYSVTEVGTDSSWDIEKVADIPYPFNFKEADDKRGVAQTIPANLGALLTAASLSTAKLIPVGDGGLYEVQLTGDLPFVRYGFDDGTNPAVLCDRTPWVSYELACEGSDPVLTNFTATIEAGSDAYVATVSLTLDGTPSPTEGNPVADGLLELVAGRMSVLRSSRRQQRKLEYNLDARRSNNELWANIIFILGFFFYFSLAFPIAMWQSWAFNPFTQACNGVLSRYRLSIYTLINLIFFIVLGLVLGVPGAFGGFLFGVLQLIAFQIFYCCKRDRDDRQTFGQRMNSASIEMGARYDDQKGRAPSLGSTFGDSADRCCCGRLANRPFRLSKMQRRWIPCHLFRTLLWLIAIVVAIQVWTVKPYSIWDRESMVVIDEYVPNTVAQGIAVVYAHEGRATQFKFKNDIVDFTTVATNWCGTLYTTKLTSDEEKKTKIKESFIDKYSINMSMYDPTSYLDYPTVNDWFIRKLAPGVRPISNPSIPSVVSPADARLVTFPTVPEGSSIWIKGETFSLASLVGEEGNPDQFDGGSLALVRLAPQDYHRFHSPVTGQITKQYLIDGVLHSVNAEAMTSGNNAWNNKRIVTIIESTDYGNVAFVAIGATCVGSVKMTLGEGDSVNKGDDIGYFQFGGSTVALVFQKDRVTYEDDIAMHSKVAIESLVQMGTQIAH